MVTTKHCSHGECNSDSRYYHKDYMKGVTFFHFPDKQIFPKKCSNWVRACRREHFTLENVNRFKYICSKHFYKGIGPTKEHPDPISANASDLQKRKFLNPRRQLIREFPAKTSNAEDSSYSSDSNSIQPGPGDGESSIYFGIKTYGKCTATRISNNSAQNYKSTEHHQTQSTNANNSLLTRHPIETFDWYATPKKRKYLKISTAPKLATEEIDMSIMISFMREGWLIGFGGYDGGLVMQFYLMENGIVAKLVSLEMITGLLKFEAYGNELDLSHHHLPEFVSTPEEISHILMVVKELKICAGAKPTVSHQDVKKSCSITVVQRASRCENCAHYHRLFAQQIRRQTRRVTTDENFVVTKKSRMNFNMMSRQQLTTAVRLQRYKFKLEKQKLKRAVKKFQQKLEHGHKLTGNDNDYFSDIIQRSLAHVEDKQLLKLMLAEQVKAAKRSKHGMRWHPEIIKWAAYLQQKSAAAYDAINSSGFFRLPSLSTLQRLSVDFKHDSGFHAHVLEDMRMQANIDNVPCHQRYVALIMDEMNIRSNIVYNKHTGELVGFSKLTDNAVATEVLEAKLNSDMTPSVATNMLALFVRGLTSSFRYSFAHFPTNKLTGNALLNVIWNAIQLLENAGFRVLVVVADGATPNRNFFKLSTYNSQLPYKVQNIYAADEPRPVYFICDVPHLLKTTRNCFLHSNSVCKPRRMRINDKDVLWSHVLEIYYKSLQSSYRIAWRLTENHVQLSSRSLMNVRLAAQVLSSRTAAAMELMVGDKASETVKFIRLFNDWFDCLNVSNTFTSIRQRNKNLMPYRSPTDWRLQWLRETFLGYLDNWKQEIANLDQFKAEEKKRMFLSDATYEGHVITVHAITEAIPFLLEKGAPYVLTSHFQQDILEQEFSKQRQRGGGNENPSVEEFCKNAKKLNAARAYAAARKNGNTIEQ